MSVRILSIKMAIIEIIIFFVIQPFALTQLLTNTYKESCTLTYLTVPCFLISINNKQTIFSVS